MVQSYFKEFIPATRKKTFTAGENIDAGKLVTFNSSGQVALASTTATNVVGVALETRSSGEAIRIGMGLIGVTVYAASGNITVGESIQPAASGKVDQYAADGTATGACGFALEASTQDGDLIKALLVLPSMQDTS